MYSFDSEVKALLSNGDYEYTLIIDEEPAVILDCIDQNTPKKVANRELQELNKLNPQDYAMLRAQGYLLMNETTGQLYWNDDKEYTGRYRRGLFEGFRKCFDNLDLYSINNDKQVIALVKPSIWYCFDNVYISTYRLHESYLIIIAGCMVLILSITTSAAAAILQQVLLRHTQKA